MTNKIRAVGAAALVAVWVALAGFAWFGQRTDISEAERRPLASAPALSLEAINEGEFMEKFEDFTLDQFPLRDSFRQIKSLFHFYGLQQLDNNDIYIKDGYAAKQVYPLNETSVNYAVKRFNDIYTQLLEGKAANCFVTVVPDKGYYLSEKAGQLTADYEKLFSMVKTGMPWANYIDLTGTLEVTDYYRTDTHWKQECLIDAASAICNAMGVTAPKASDYTVNALERPFYGVYYGQAALPMEPDTLCLMESELLDGCSVNYLDYTAMGAKVGKVYDMDKYGEKDMYELYLAGPRSLIVIDNPNAKTDRELVVFRDSFGSSMTPLLVQDYAKVTLVDIRYIHPNQTRMFVNYEGADVLFLYSTLVLNDSSAIRP